MLQPLLEQSLEKEANCHQNHNLLSSSPFDVAQHISFRFLISFRLFLHNFCSDYFDIWYQRQMLLDTLDAVNDEPKASDDINAMIRWWRSDTNMVEDIDDIFIDTSPIWWTWYQQWYQYGRGWRWYQGNGNWGVGVSRDSWSLWEPGRPFQLILIRSDLDDESSSLYLYIFIWKDTKSQRRDIFGTSSSLKMLLMPGPEQIFSLDFMVDKLEIHQAGDVGVLVGNLRLTVNSFDAGSDEIQSSIWEGLLPLTNRRDWVDQGVKILDIGLLQKSKQHILRGWKNQA